MSSFYKYIEYIFIYNKFMGQWILIVFLTKTHKVWGDMMTQ